MVDPAAKLAKTHGGEDIKKKSIREHARKALAAAGEVV